MFMEKAQQFSVEFEFTKQNLLTMFASVCKNSCFE